MTKKIINGRRYDTETAKLVGEWDNRQAINDFRYECETLYRKRNGEYFLHGEGGAMSRYAESRGNNSWVGGEAITPLSYDAAREWAQTHLDADDYEAAFGAVTEDGEDVTVTVRVSASTKALLERLASQGGMTQSDVVAAALAAYAG